MLYIIYTVYEQNMVNTYISFFEKKLISWIQGKHNDTKLFYTYGNFLRRRNAEMPKMAQFGSFFNYKIFWFLLIFNKVNSKSPNSLIAPSNFSTLKTSFMTSIMIHTLGIVHILCHHIFGPFLTTHPPTHYFSINIVLNVSKNLDNPPNHPALLLT